MHGKLFVVIAAAFLVREIEPLNIPSYFLQCARSDPNFNQCAAVNGQKAIPQLVKGDRKYKIPSMNPLHLPLLDFNQGGNLNIKLIDSKVFGLEKTVVQSCNFDFNNKRISMSFSLPQMIVDSKYEMNGKILVLPIYGNGPSHLQLENLTFKYDYSYNIVKKNNVDYVEPKKGKITYELGGMTLRFDNLFNGDKLLGEETNNFLNENWKDVNKELGPGLVEALAEVVHLIIGNVCSLVPFDEMFPETL